MKKFQLLALAIVIIRFIPTSFAQTTATASGSVRLLTPIKVVKDLDLRFGSVLTENAAGTIIIGHTGAAVRTTAFSDISNGDPFGAAKFTVTGTKNETFSITLPSTITLDASEPSLGTEENHAPLIVSDFTSDHPINGTLDAYGKKIVLVGAKLTITVNHHGGVFTGEFTVTVNYN